MTAPAKGSILAVQPDKFGNDYISLGPNADDIFVPLVLTVWLRDMDFSTFDKQKEIGVVFWGGSGSPLPNNSSYSTKPAMIADSGLIGIEVVSPTKIELILWKYKGMLAQTGNPPGVGYLALALLWWGPGATGRFEWHELALPLTVKKDSYERHLYYDKGDILAVPRARIRG